MLIRWSRQDVVRYENLLYAHGLRYGGPGMALAEQMIRIALDQIDPDQSPALWAQTQNNLAIALQEQGIRTGGAAGTGLLARAVSACDAALSIYTRADHPVQWAMTKENLAIAELARADHPAGGDPQSHLEAALQHVQAALTVYDPEHMPYDHGTATTLRDKIKARLDAGPPEA